MVRKRRLGGTVTSLLNNVYQEVDDLRTV